VSTAGSLETVGALPAPTGEAASGTGTRRSVPASAPSGTRTCPEACVERRVQAAGLGSATGTLLRMGGGGRTLTTSPVSSSVASISSPTAHPSGTSRLSDLFPARDGAALSSVNAAFFPRFSVTLTCSSWPLSSFRRKTSSTLVPYAPVSCGVTETTGLQSTLFPLTAMSRSSILISPHDSAGLLPGRSQLTAKQ